MLPLLAIYEIGLYAQGLTTPEQLRNGADVWLRAALSEVGVSPIYGAPCLLVFVLLLWGLWKRDELPTDKLGTWIGMTIESAGYAVLLMALSQGLWLALLRADNVFGQPSHRRSPVRNIYGFLTLFNEARMRVKPGKGESLPLRPSHDLGRPLLRGPPPQRAL